jgi:ferritin
MAVNNLLSTEAQAVIADAVHAELWASHLYKHIANHMQRLGYFGAQKWFAKESADELTHYQGHVDFVNDMGGAVNLPALQEVADTPASLRDALQLAYDTELALMGDYTAWYAAVDAITQQHLLQYVEIQRKSVGEYGDWLARLDRVGDDLCGVLIIDKELGE